MIYKKASVSSAIVLLDPTAQVSVSGNSVDKIIWYDGNPNNITKEQILAKQTELQAELDGQTYARSRELEYPSWKEQYDLQYHDKVNSTTTWQDAIKAVKDKYPKPE